MHRRTTTQSIEFGSGAERLPSQLNASAQLEISQRPTGGHCAFDDLRADAGSELLAGRYDRPISPQREAAAGSNIVASLPSSVASHSFRS